MGEHLRDLEPLGPSTDYYHRFWQGFNIHDRLVREIPDIRKTVDVQGPRRSACRDQEPLGAVLSTVNFDLAWRCEVGAAFDQINTVLRFLHVHIVLLAEGVNDSTFLRNGGLEIEGGAVSVGQGFEP